VGLGENGASLSWWFLTLAILGALNAAVAAAYYLRIISVMYFRPAAESASYAPRSVSAASVAAGVCTALVLALGLYQAPLAEWSGRAERSLRSGMQRTMAHTAQVAVERH